MTRRLGLSCLAAAGPAARVPDPAGSRGDRLDLSLSRGP
jgi:hypothetical protein